MLCKTMMALFLWSVTVVYFCVLIHYILIDYDVNQLSKNWLLLNFSCFSFFKYLILRVRYLDICINCENKLMAHKSKTVSLAVVEICLCLAMWRLGACAVWMGTSRGQWPSAGHGGLVLSDVRNIGVFVVSMGTTAVGCAALRQLTQHAINCSTLCSTVVIPVHRFEQTITVDVIASLMMSLISSY